MKIKDLPTTPFPKKTLNRRIYSVFWAPFQTIIEVISGFFASMLRAAFWLGAAWLFFMSLILFIVFR